MSRARSALALALSAAAALAACAALASGLDRMQRVSSAERRALAVDRLRAAVAADPVDPATSAALGLNRLAAGDGAGAVAAFRVSGQLGWRDLPTQLFWLSAAADAGDQQVAVDRLDAVLRQNPALLEQPGLLAPLERSVEGRRALAAHLAARPPWFGGYWNRTFMLSPEQLSARARLLDEPALGAPRIRCNDVRGFAGTLAARGRVEEARTILLRSCAAQSLVADGGFERARLDDASPLGWRFVGAGGVDLRFVGAAPGRSRALSVASALPYRIVFASQAVQLAPGPYEMSWRARSAAGGRSRRVTVRLACQPGVGGYAAPDPARGDRWVARFEIAGPCPAPTLELAILPGVGTVVLDDLTLALRD